MLSVHIFPSPAGPRAVQTASIPTWAGPALWPERRKLLNVSVVKYPGADERM